LALIATLPGRSSRPIAARLPLEAAPSVAVLVSQTDYLLRSVAR